MTAQLSTLVPALGFTLGCVGIHALRGHAAQVSGALQGVTCALIVMLIVVELSRTTRIELTDQMAFDMAGALAPLPSKIP